MNDWMTLVLRWNPLIIQVILLFLQIYAYRRTRHYSLALLATGSVIGFLSATLARVLYSGTVYPSLVNGVYYAMFILYVAYAVIGIWGAVALFRSYIQLTDTNKLVTTPAGN